VIEWLLIAAEKERRVHYVIGAFAFASIGIYTFFMFGWQRWPDQWIWPGMPGVMVLSFALAFAAVYAFVPVLQIRRAAVVGLVLMGVVLSLVRGPLQWGVFAYAEPGPTNPNLHDVEVMYHPVQYYPPDQMNVETNAKFGDSIALLGFDTYREESMLTLVLHYRVDQIVSTPYHVFVHVWDPESGSLRGGRDTVLLNRQALTTNFWKSGEHVSQEIAIDLSNIPSGKYVVGTGLYDLATSVRLAVVDEHGAAIPDGWLPIIEGLSVP
ncbi:MAG: hypothetical protein ACE5FI_06910, partial [Anaerolineales bacterium]